MAENRCTIVNDKLHNLGQYIIYFFNKLPTRSNVIQQTIKKDKKENVFSYFGTWYVEGKKNKLTFTTPYDSELHPNLESLSTTLNVQDFVNTFKDKFKMKQKIVFTVCYCYKENSVHFVSFIYDSSNKQLYHFDPGINLYPEGQSVLVPSIVNCFIKASLIPKRNHTEIGKQCPRYIYKLKEEQIGIQYNGESKDAFCQCWTLCFLVDEIHKFDKSIKNYCRIKPPNRTLYLFQQFIIPFLESDPSYMEKIIEEFRVQKKGRILKPKTYLRLLKEKVKVCKIKKDSPKQKDSQRKKKP